MATKFNEGDRVKALRETKLIKGINVITVRAGDILRVIGYDRFGDICARFDDCADLPAIHDAFFGKFYLPAESVEAI